MKKVYVTTFNDSQKRHASPNCIEYLKTDKAFTHTMDKSLAQELRVPVCWRCRPKNLNSVNRGI